jgi:phenylalanyl-tRNA synthetase beta chain
MKISWKWLASLVDLEGMTPQELSDQLTMCGLEVEGIEAFGADPNLDTVVVAHIDTIEQHPDADKLVVCSVNAGEHGIKQIVCGAKNMKAGDKVPLAMVGSRLPGDLKIKKGKLRGVVSEGMLCSGKELNLGDDHDGLMILAEDMPVGTPVLKALDLADTIIDISVTPNRPDALSHLGVARDVAALTGRALTWPRFARDWRATSRGDAVRGDAMPWEGKVEQGAAIEGMASVDLQDVEGCPRYALAVLEGLKVGPSPEWMANRLLAIGQRPINNLVDVTNYVLHECGQPLHAFDLDKLHEGKIIIRRATDGEEIETLDGATRKLLPRDVVIADPAGPVAIAGVMGGASSEVSVTTTRVAIECAHFNPTFVRKTARRLGLHSESSHRFERGVDPEGVPHLLMRAVELLIATQDGPPPTLARGILDVHPAPRARKQVQLPVAEYTRVIGTEPGSERIAAILDALDLPATLKGDVFHVDVPTFRPDIERPVDLVEEIARIEGLDAIPAVLPPGVMGFAHTLRADGGDRHETIVPLEHESAVGDARRHLLGQGLLEAVNYNFVASSLTAALGFPADDVRSAPIVVRNPLSEEMDVMRTSLLVGLLQNLRHNRSHRVAGANLFEVGHAYLRLDREDAPVGDHVGGPRWDAHAQPLLVAGILADPSAEHYTGTQRFDLADTRRFATDLVRILGRQDATVAQWTEGTPAFVHPLAAGKLYCGDVEVGWFASLHPDLLATLDVDGEVAAFELDASRLLELRRGLPTMSAIARYPGSERDFALVVDATTSYAQVESALGSFIDRRLVAHELFDVYAGEQLGEGKKSLAIKVKFQDARKTLSDKALTQLQGRLVDHLSKELGATLR